MNHHSKLVHEVSSYFIVVDHMQGDLTASKEEEPQLQKELKTAKGIHIADSDANYGCHG